MELLMTVKLQVCDESRMSYAFSSGQRAHRLSVLAESENDSEVDEGSPPRQGILENPWCNTAADEADGEDVSMETGPDVKDESQSRQKHKSPSVQAPRMRCPTRPLPSEAMHAGTRQCRSSSI